MQIALSSPQALIDSEQTPRQTEEAATWWEESVSCLPNFSLHKYKLTNTNTNTNTQIQTQNTTAVVSELSNELNYCFRILAAKKEGAQ